MQPLHRVTTVFALALLGCGLVLGSAGFADAATLAVGKDKQYKLPSAAIAAAKEGDHVDIDPGEYFDCAVVEADKLVIEGVGDADKVLMTDKACKGKALLVTVGDDITVRNMTLTRARVPDGNGAGIRAEGQNLTVDGVHFVNNQDGILTTDGMGTLTVRNSLFDRNGTCEQACSHGIYAGHIDKLVVEKSTFIGTKQGHHIKSRALVTEVTGCTIDDGPTGTASYEIDISNGGTLIARDNTITKGPKAENHTAAIMIGAEGITQPTREITVENNKFRNAGSYGTFLVYNQTATEAQVKNNQISGKAQALHGDGEASP